jgi:hypothetical protein
LGADGSVQFVMSVVRDFSEDTHFSVARRLEIKDECVDNQAEKSCRASTPWRMRKDAILHMRYAFSLLFAKLLTHKSKTED